jgi:hypothetical protein
VSQALCITAMISSTGGGLAGQRRPILRGAVRSYSPALSPVTPAAQRRPGARASSSVRPAPPVAGAPLGLSLLDRSAWRPEAAASVLAWLPTSNPATDRLGGGGLASTSVAASAFGTSASSSTGGPARSCVVHHPELCLDTWDHWVAAARDACVAAQHARDVALDEAGVGVTPSSLLGIARSSSRHVATPVNPCAA